METFARFELANTLWFGYPSGYDPDHTQDDEDCLVCGDPSDGGWWGDGCSPLCHQCSFSTTNGEMERLSKKLNHGPIPELKGD